jgi:hypothetical protein
MATKKQQTVKLCGPECQGLCRKDIRNVAFCFNSVGMICRSLPNTQITERRRLDGNTLLWLMDASQKDIQSRGMTGKRAKQRWASIEQKQDWPKTGFVLDENYNAWSIAANCIVEREASVEEVAVFIGHAARSVTGENQQQGHEREG